jgi:predicted enzyme related to lactoylglutathione lyase
MAQLGYFTLDTLDVEKARAFYGALFGWTFDEDASGPTYAHVADSDPAFGLTKVERAGAFTHLYFRVDDIAAACARVVELGGKAAVPSESKSGLSAVVADD